MSESHLPELPGLDKSKCTSVFNRLSPSSYRNQAARVLWSEEDLSGKSICISKTSSNIGKQYGFSPVLETQDAFRWDVFCLP